MEDVKLAKGQEINNISLRSSDNGGIILSFCIYTQSPSKNQNGWDDRTETYEAEEFESKVLPRIIMLYRLDYENRMKGNKPKEEKPITAKGY